MCSLSLVDTVISEQCANGLPQFEMKSRLIQAATSEIPRNSIFIFFECFKTKIFLHSYNFSHVKYFQMLEIQILLPLLFRTDFPGYRGFQYVHDFLVFESFRISFNVRNSYPPAMTCLLIPMLTLHIHSQHLRLYYSYHG